MKFIQIRNATALIEFDHGKMIIDPMLARKGTLPKLRYYKSDERNPLNELPDVFYRYKEKIDYALITHCQKGHFDHLDRAGVHWLAKHRIPTFCTPRDEKYLGKKQILTRVLTNKRSTFFGGSIERIPATHTRGWLSPFMEHGTGYFIQLPNEPSLYLMGDTVLTDSIRDFIQGVQPDYIIAPTGKAQFDIGAPLLLDENEIIELASLSTGRIICNHMGALDHCRIDHNSLASLLGKHAVEHRYIIPADGATVILSTTSKTKSIS